MLKDIIGHLDLYGLTEAATVIFLAVFVLVALVTLLRPKAEMKKWAEIPTSAD